MSQLLSTSVGGDQTVRTTALRDQKEKTKGKVKNIPPGVGTQLGSFAPYDVHDTFGLLN